MKLRLLVIAVALLSSMEALAGFEPLEGCKDDKGAAIRTVKSSGNKWVVRAADERGKPVIAVDYAMASKLYVGRDTIRWLYFRECAHLVLGHQGLGRPSPASQEAADCWALRQLVKGRDEWESRKLTVTITRDLEGLGPKQWEQLRLGQRRDPDIGFRCNVTTGHMNQ